VTPPATNTQNFTYRSNFSVLHRSVYKKFERNSFLIKAIYSFDRTKQTLGASWRSNIWRQLGVSEWLSGDF
jgi:hypothetical protein